MTNMQRFGELIFLSMILRLCASSTVVTDPLGGRKVLLVSLDGFRYDYFEKTSTPNFDAMISSGVKVPYVNNTFVTSTFPCHTSIATGLYEESHGIVGNKFYDPLYDSYFSMGSIEPKWWNASEPIWTNAVKSGLKVGTFFWPGTDVPHDGILPTSYRHYDGKVRFVERIRTAVRWLSRDNYQFAIVYFNDPDHTSHTYGPEDPHVIPAIQNMDFVVGMLISALEKAKIRDKVDVIVTSDHGMATIDMVNKTIDITDYVSKTLLAKAIPSFGPAMNLKPQPGKAQELVDALKGIEHIHVFLKADIPEHFHYRNNRRVSPVFVYADEGWTLITNKKRAKQIHLKGFHGFDNSLMSMKPIFVASGPSFKSGYELPGPIKSVDIYPLLCHLLKLTPVPNNGSLERVAPLLAGKGVISIYSTNLLLIGLVFCSLV